MTDYRPRLFASDADVVRVGEGLLAADLPRAEWTHEAHLGATAYLLLRHPEVDLDAELPGLIRRYNESVGGVNSDSERLSRDDHAGVPARHSRVSGRSRLAGAAARHRKRAASFSDGCP